MNASKLGQVELILGNSNPKFSGVTSTMLQALRYQKELIPLVVLGSHHLPKNILSVNFYQAIKLCKHPLPNGKTRVFHARRNNEMLQALALKQVSPNPLKIVFTSTAQREHTWITRWLMRQADAVISTCTAAASYIHGDADVIIPHGVDLDRFQPSIDRSALWSKLGFPGKYGIGIFGRVRHQKGVDVLIEAILPLLKDFPDFTVIICGETTTKHKNFERALKAKIATTGMQERFIFLGKQPFSSLPELFQSMHLVTALSRNEGYGLTVLEAMASGTSVIASEAGAWQDIVRPGLTGEIVPCGNIIATRNKLKSLLSDTKKLEEMGRNGRKIAEENYSLKNEANSLIHYFRKLQVVDSL